MIKAIEQDLIQEKYEEYLTTIKTDFNTAAWEKLEISTDKNMKTSNIMEIFQSIAV